MSTAFLSNCHYSVSTELFCFLCLSNACNKDKRSNIFSFYTFKNRLRVSSCYRNGRYLFFNSNFKQFLILSIVPCNGKVYGEWVIGKCAYFTNFLPKFFR